MRLLPQSYRSQLHQGKEEEEAGSERRARKRGGEPHARTQGDQDLNSGPTTACLPGSSLASCSFAPHSPVCSPSVRPAASRPPSVRGVIIMDVSRGNAPFVDSFTVIIFLLARFTVNFGAHTRTKRRGGWACTGEQGREEMPTSTTKLDGGGGWSGSERERRRV